MAIQHKNANSVKKWANILGIAGSVLAIATPVFPASIAVYLTTATGLLNFAVRQIDPESESKE